MIEKYAMVYMKLNDCKHEIIYKTQFVNINVCKNKEIYSGAFIVNRQARDMQRQLPSLLVVINSIQYLALHCVKDTAMDKISSLAVSLLKSSSFSEM